MTMRLSSAVLVSVVALTAGVNTAFCGEDADVVAYWNFDKATGAEIVDASGNGHGGTAHGHPAYVKSPAGHALALDGRDDYVSVPHSDGLRLCDGGTIEL